MGGGAGPGAEQTRDVALPAPSRRPYRGTLRPETAATTQRAPRLSATDPPPTVTRGCLTCARDSKGVASKGPRMSLGVPRSVPVRRLRPELGPVCGAHTHTHSPSGRPAGCLSPDRLSLGRRAPDGAVTETGVGEPRFPHPLSRSGTGSTSPPIPGSDGRADHREKRVLGTPHEAGTRQRGKTRGALCTEGGPALAVRP